MTRRLAASVLAFTLCVACGSGEPKLETIPIDGRPSAVALGGGLVWITDDENHAVVVIDPDRDVVVGPPIDMKRNPIAIAGGDDAIWVAHASGWLLRVDPRRRAVTERVRERASFTGVALLGGVVWATDVDRGLYRFDPRHPKDARWTTLPDGAVRVLAHAPHLWVTGREDTVTRFDPRTRRTKVYKVGMGPIGLASDGRRVWVANSDDGTVQTTASAKREQAKEDTADGRVYKVGRGPVAVAFTGKRMWVANQDDATVSLVEPDGQTTAIPIGIGPRGMASDDQAVWIAGTNPGGVVRVEP